MSAPTPVELADHLTLPELTHRCVALSQQLAEARLGVTDPPAEEVRERALQVLALRHAAADRALRGRWTVVLQALAAGAPVADVARACGLDVDEVVFGLRRWADVQLDNGWMTAEQHAAAVALVDGAGR